MSVMGFQKITSLDGGGGWVGWVSSIQFLFLFFYFAKPLIHNVDEILENTSHCTVDVGQVNAKAVSEYISINHRQDALCEERTRRCTRRIGIVIEKDEYH